MVAPLLPVSPAPGTFEISSRVTNVRSESASGKLLTRRIGGQRFEVTLVYPPMTPAQAAPIVAFLESQEGGDGIFYVEMPVFSGTAGEYSGNVINFNNDTKLFRVIGEGPTVVYPAERIGGGIIQTSPVYFRGSLARDVQKVRYPDDDFVRLEIDLIERI